MKRWLKRLILGAVVPGMVMANTACSLGGIPKSNEKQTVRLYDNTDFIKSQLPLLEKQEKQVELKIEGISDYRSREEKVDGILELLKNEPPDALVLPLDEARLLFQKGLLADLSTFIKSNRELKGQVRSSLLELTVASGKQYGFPVKAAPLVIYFNKDWFTKAGLPFPKETWTWDQFAETSRSIMAANCAVDEDMCFGSVLPYNLELLAPLIHAYGGRFVDSVGGTANGLLNGSSTERALLWAKRLMVNDKSAPLVWSWTTSSRVGAPRGIPDYQKAFLLNKVGMMLASSEMYFDLKKTMPDKLGVAGLPATKEGVHLNGPWSTLFFVIPEKSKNKEAAWELVPTLLGQAQENTSWNALNYYFLPVTRNQSEPDKVAEIFSREMEFIRDILPAEKLVKISDPYMEQILKSPDEDIHGILTNLAGEFEHLRKESERDKDLDG